MILVAQIASLPRSANLDWKRLQEPSFVAAALSCVLLIALLALRSGTHSSDSSSPSVDVLSQLREFEEAISITQAHLNKGGFAPAFDMVMVASRLAPSDPRLFDLVIQFIEKAKPSDNEDVIAMADDLLDRGDSLVHFQSPENVESSRKRITDLRQSFSEQKPQATPPNPLDSVRNLLAVAENSSVQLSVRSRAVEQARTALGDVQLNQALAMLEKAGQVGNDDLQKIDIQIDKAEKQCIQELYLQSKSKIDQWLTATSALTKEIDTAPSEKVPSVSKTVTALLNQGYDHLQELMPYSKSGVEGASDFYNATEKQVKLLQRQKNWLYNQQTLRLVREVESKKDWTPEDKIRHLAEVSEELLSSYVLRRHNELWDKVFESLPDEDKKVWAVRLRILRLNE